MSCDQRVQLRKRSTKGLVKQHKTVRPSRVNVPYELFNSYVNLCAQIDHFTVVCLVTWPLNESEAGVDLVLIENSLITELCARS